MIKSIKTNLQKIIILLITILSILSMQNVYAKENKGTNEKVRDVDIYNTIMNRFYDEYSNPKHYDTQGNLIKRNVEGSTYGWLNDEIDEYNPVEMEEWKAGESSKNRYDYFYDASGKKWTRPETEEDNFFFQFESNKNNLYYDANGYVTTEFSSDEGGEYYYNANGYKCYKTDIKGDMIYKGEELSDRVRTASGSAALEWEEEQGAFHKYDDLYYVFCCEQGAALTNGITCYKFGPAERATPMEAYILADMEDNTWGWSDVQQAWWNTPANEGTSGAYNSLTAEAEHFESYVSKLSSNGTYAFRTEQTNLVVGNNNFDGLQSNGFDLKYEPKWVKNGLEESPKWDQTTQTYLVGPFSIDYVEDYFNGGKGIVEFAGITNMHVYTDYRQDELTFNEDWSIVYLDGERDTDDNSTYPHQNEEFYIRLNYKENMTQLLNVKVDFKYMNAAGSFQKSTSSHACKQKECEHEDCPGCSVCGEQGHHHKTGSHQQKLAYAQFGARWYEETQIDTKTRAGHYGRIKIEKRLVDEDGNRLTSTEGTKFFTFKVTVNGKTDMIKVKAGSSAFTDYYYWSNNEAAPSYTVEEVEDDDYTQVNITNSSGVLKADQTIQVVATNSIGHEGRLRIVKNVVGSMSGDATFKFSVTITGTFYYNGEKYNNTTLTLSPEIFVDRDDKTNDWVSDTITWNGEAPTYKVAEINTTRYSLRSLSPSKGNLIDGKTVTVTAVNGKRSPHHDYDQAKLHIIKTLKNADQYTDDYINSLTFKFRITVDGNASTVTLSPTKQDDNTYVWEYTSGYYYWRDNESAPEYTIEEIDVPDGTEVQSSTDGTSYTAGKTITGRLTSSATDNYVIDNYFINDLSVKHGTLQITKKIIEEALKNKDYKFVVTVSGTFQYKGTDYTNTTIRLTNSGVADSTDNNGYVTINIADATEATWNSDTFTWHGEAPTYTVQEDMTGIEDIYSTIAPSSGSLENSNNIIVTAVNGMKTETGKLSIVKTLENASKFTDEYVKSLEFKFRIHVDGYEEFDVTLKAEKVNDQYVWYYEEEFSWNADEEAPHYWIEELDGPEGTSFVSANGGSDKKVEGQLKPDTQENYTIENHFVNKLEEKTGKLIIDKKVLDDSLTGKEFKFNVTLTGTFTYQGMQYENDSYTFEAIVNGGEKWTSDTIGWQGEGAPTYTVEEQESDIANQTAIVNGAGTIVEGDTNAQVVTVTNEAKLDGGYLQITKQLVDGATSNQSYKFNVKVYYGDLENPEEVLADYIVEVKAGETYRSEEFKWDKAKGAPTYTVEEIDTGAAQFDSISNGTDTITGDRKVSGQLSGSGELVIITAINKVEQHHGKIRVTKKAITDEKMQEEAMTDEFTIQITLFGSFEVNGESIVDGSKTIETTIKAGGTYETPDITWFGNEGPSYTVTETNLPTGWHLENISNGNGQLSADANTADVVVTNSFETRVIVDLTLELGGTVWEDVPQDESSKNTPDSVENGVIDDTEVGLDGVEVYIYKVIYNGSTEVSRELAYGYIEAGNDLAEYPIVTQNGGKWNSPRMSMPVVTDQEKASGYTASYDVEFVYDGQKYEPTKFLATANGDAATYRNASTSARDQYLKDSHALDYNRQEVDSRITQITGESPIDGNGNTIGNVVAANGDKNPIYYNATDYTTGVSGTTRKVSELQTTYDNGVVYDIFKAKARTSVGGLTYPFDGRTYLESIDKYIDELGAVEEYKYSATYPYTLNINLGLKKRPDADLGTTKDLVSAKVVVNEKLLNYKFNSLADLTGDAITRQLTADTMNISYELGLYKTDYYYRAEMYQTNGRVYDAINTFYKTLNPSLTYDDTELEVYLTYKITVSNDSPTGIYVAGINAIDDYFDSSFGVPISTAVTKYVRNIDDENIGDLTPVEVANISYLTSPTQEKLEVNWTVSDTDTNILGSDGITYRKMTATFENGQVQLRTGEKADIYVTFAVQKDDINGVKDAIVLGQKANVAEIANYSTYYEDGSIAGKIDRDSAPSNVNIESFNDRTWYEDDTDSAPILNLTLNETTRTIDGLAWEDKRTENIEGQKVGNGLYDEGEALIGGLTTELVEKVKVNDQEYDFLWPTNQSLDILGGRTLESLTGFDSTIETARVSQTDADGNQTLGVGGYKFIGVPAGEYIVRFLYGNDKTKLEDTFGITGDPEALTESGASYHTENDIQSTENPLENNDILVANYDNKPAGQTPSVYNGQDFKTTAYHASGDRNSDAKDSELRRLEVMANSETITNINGTVLSKADSNLKVIAPEAVTRDTYTTSNHTGLYTDYYMFADTDKINMNIEDIAKPDYLVDNDITTVKGTILGGMVEVQRFVYEVKNIDIGLEERPRTEVVLDKEISGIKLVTSDNTTIFDVAYNISYDRVPRAEINNRTIIGQVGNGDEYIVATVGVDLERSIGTDVLQAINKVEDKYSMVNGENMQNFRFINVDESILQGLTIEMQYQLTALNIGEIDRISTTLRDVMEDVSKTPRDAILEIVASAIPERKTIGETTIEQGKYLGNIYYLGSAANTNNQEVVTTTVRQLVDYVDNDTVFSADYNKEKDHSWKNATINEVTGNGFEADRLLDRDIILQNNIQDDKGKVYITPQKKNIVVSVDSIEDTEELTNKGFEAKLLPYDQDPSQYQSVISSTLTRTIASEDDANHVAFDNLAEIVKIDNTAGRRDVTAIPGNADPKEGEFDVSITERDASATELITLTPPTGIEAENELTLQILVIIAVGLGIVATGIVIIKKKVLTK